MSSMEKCTGIDWLRSARPEPRKVSGSDLPLPVLAEARPAPEIVSKLSASTQRRPGSTIWKTIPKASP